MDGTGLTPSLASAGRRGKKYANLCGKRSVIKAMPLEIEHAIASMSAFAPSGEWCACTRLTAAIWWPDLRRAFERKCAARAAHGRDELLHDRIGLTVEEHGGVPHVLA